MKLVMFPNGALSRYEEVPAGCIEVEYEKKPQYPTVLVDQTEAANGKHGKETRNTEETYTAFQGAGR